MTERYREDFPASGSVARVAVGDRFHWPSIVGGTFIALSLFAISGVLARAVGLDYTFQTAMTRGQQVATIIWGGLSAIICFWLGSWVTVQTSVVSHRNYALLNGAMVWAVAVPLLIYFLGTSTGPRLEPAAVGEGGALQASAQMDRADGGRPVVGSPYTVGQAQAAAWWMLVSLCLGLIAACLAGYAGARVLSENRSFGETRPSTGGV